MMRKRWSGLCAVILLAGLIAVNGGVGTAQSPSDTTSPALVRGVAVSQEGGRVTLSVQASGPLGYETRTLAGPLRLLRRVRLRVAHRGVFRIRDPHRFVPCRQFPLGFLRRELVLV